MGVYFLFCQWEEKKNKTNPPEGWEILQTSSGRIWDGFVLFTTFNFWLLASNRTNCRHEGYEVSTGCYCEYWPSDPRHILPMFCQFVQAASRQSVPTIPTRIVKFCGFGPACFRLNINIRTSRFLVQAEWPSVLFKSSINIINTQEHSRRSKNIIEP